jgi:hypothetical protein
MDAMGDSAAEAGVELVGAAASPPAAASCSSFSSPSIKVSSDRVLTIEAVGFSIAATARAAVHQGLGPLEAEVVVVLLLLLPGARDLAHASTLRNSEPIVSSCSSSAWLAMRPAEGGGGAPPPSSNSPLGKYLLDIRHQAVVNSSIVVMHKNWAFHGECSWRGFSAF